MSKKALVVDISFFESFFKVHYTKLSRLTYPIPLPTTVAGMFGSLLGFSRGEICNKFSGCLFGAINKHTLRRSTETATYILPERGRRGADTIHLMNEPLYSIILCGEEDEIREWEKKISDGIEFLPFGGQNDFFSKDWRLMGVTEIVTSNKISNYLPNSWVAEILPGTRMEILPVMHKLSSDNNFLFIYEGAVKAKKEIEAVKIDERFASLYKLEDFYQVKR